MADRDMGMMIGVLFLAREVAHREHLRVRGVGSYAAHMALGDFYDAVGEMGDSICEVYQGRFNAILDIPLATNEGELPIIDFLEAQRDWIRENRFKAAPKDETPIQNLIDEVEALYDRTLYKLRFLS